MQPTGIGVRDRDRGVVRKLALVADRGLQEVRGPKCATDALDGARLKRSGERGKRRRNSSWAREEVRVVDDELLLHYAVKALGGECIGEAKAIVEDPEAGADDSVERFRGCSWRPRHTDSRSKIAPIVDVGLRFVTQAEAGGEVRANFPVITEESPQVELVARDLRIAAIDAELRRDSLAN